MPPRKLIFTRRSSSDMLSDSPKFSSVEETNFRKFLPYNNISSAGGGDGVDSDQYDDSNDDPYSSDHFRMYEFKVRRCTRSRSHDWTDCPFAHPGEKARRRDPRRFHYSGTVCSEFRQGGCSRGDNCEFAHGVFECWLHPARYRTEACKGGKNCKRKNCFFAHTPNQLRILPPTTTTACTTGAGDLNFNSSSDEEQFRNLLLNSSPAENNKHRCCVHCHQSSKVISSPTSTLVRMPHFSPPASPSPPLSPVSRLCSVSEFPPNQLCELMKRYNTSSSSNAELLNELMSSMESMHVSNGEGNYWGSSYEKNNNKLWVDVMNNNNDQDYHPHNQTRQYQFIHSPASDGTDNYFVNHSPSGFSGDFEKQVNNENGGGSCPDLGWVNDLLM